MQKLKTIIPLFIRKAILRKAQQFLFPIAVLELKRAIGKGKIDEKLLSRLVFGWGNAGFSAKPEYLMSCVEFAFKADRAIAECGSGLSTLVIGMIAQKKGLPLLSFEHNDQWAEKINKTLKKYKVSNVTVHTTQLVHYGHFEWYDISKIGLPDDIDMIICDGPPGNSQWARYGLIPVMGRQLKPGAIILMDDMARVDEQLTVERWKEKMNFTVEVRGKEQEHAVLRLV